MVTVIVAPPRSTARLQAAHRSAQQHYYHWPRQPQLRPPVVVLQPGPAFTMIIAPAAYHIHVPPPESGLHLQANSHDAVLATTEIVLVLIVFVIVAGKVVSRIVPLRRDDTSQER
jgi:hypothetical protein